MKLLSILSLAILTVIAAPKAHAFSQENAVENAVVECDTFGGDVNFYLRIGAPYGGSWQDADLYLRSGDGGRYSYTVIRSTTGFSEVRYWGAKFELNVDVFMTGGAKFYQTYDAMLSSADVNDGKPVRARCEFFAF